MFSKREIILLIILLIGVLFMTVRKYLRPFDKIIEKMAFAIEDWEGYVLPGHWFKGEYYPNGSVSFKNNNPGNLKNAGQKGVIGSDPQGHAIFDTYSNGWKALIRQLELAFYGGSRIYTSKDTLYDFFSNYAEANSSNYAEFVAGQIGVRPDQALETFPQS